MTTWNAARDLNPSLGSFFLLWDDETKDEVLGPDICRRATRPKLENDPPGHALCKYFPVKLCEVDQDPNKGGTGDWHRLLAVLYDVLYGTKTMTGLLDDVRSFPCIVDIDNAPDAFLDAMLVHYGFNLEISLTDLQKRKLLGVLIPMYRLTGTDPGIQNALQLLLGVPATILSLNDANTNWLQCGVAPSRTMTAIVSTSDYFEPQHPERFKVGTMLIITDDTAPFVPFVPTLITSIVSNKVYFVPQTLSGTIEIGAYATCTKYTSQVGPSTTPEIYPMGPNKQDRQDAALYTIHVDVQKTVLTTTLLQDGGTSVDVVDTDFILVGSRVQLTDMSAPSQPPIIVRILTVDEAAKTITFDGVSLIEDIEIGAEAINLFTQEQIDTIDAIVNFSKFHSAHHFITRDEGTDLATIG